MIKRHPTVLLLIGIAAGACGCSSFLREGTADLAGVGGAAIAGSVTDNAAVATICRDADRWKWASAESVVGSWDSLH